MMDKMFILSLLSIATLTASAQVTIGSGYAPSKAALLELKDKDANKPASVTDDLNVTSETGGLLLPRVKLENKNTLQPFIDTSNSDWVNRSSTKISETHAGLMVYNLNTTTDGLSPGIHVWDGTQWAKSAGGSATTEAGFFYMPSFNLLLSADSGMTLTCDLYQTYVDQFTVPAGQAAFVTSNPALTSAPLYDRQELDYIVTAYDGSVIEILGIDQSGATKGTLRYKAKVPQAPAGSFVNIIFVVKD